MYLISSHLSQQDSTFEFERKRNRPQRYDRISTEQVLQAIPKITKVKATREADHIKKRFVDIPFCNLLHEVIFEVIKRCFHMRPCVLMHLR
jgi:vancomycin resistance protein YoaR